MSELFESKGNFQVVRLSEADARAYTDNMHNFRKLVLECEPEYPNIKKWVDKKVIPGVKSLERVAYIGYLDEKPAVSAVLKRGRSTKFCHLKIREDIQDVNLGDAFFALMGLEARSFAKEVHFTLPGSLWAEKTGFFKSFGFDKVVKAGEQYRLFDEELRCSAPFMKVWDATLSKLPKLATMFSMNGNSVDNQILMSIKSRYANKILDGQKKVEIRRKFSKKWEGQKVCLYATKPKGSLVGEALIKKVVAGTPENIWKQFNVTIGCTKEEFDSYTNATSQVYAIVLEDATPYRKTISINDIAELTNKKLRPPQSYCSLRNNSDWAEAVSMGSLLQQSFRSNSPLIL